ncbi:MAG: hypothetical protein LBJ70_01580 [Holosporales bacterium]|jgi:hypothetical protein|nr:hypothetical protein [Holosporales bacterium]
MQKVSALVLLGFLLSACGGLSGTNEDYVSKHTLLLPPNAHKLPPADPPPKKAPSERTPEKS